MIIRSHRRAGFSLTEALIAIFVMALGLMGVLSLFPLGAMTMAYAIKDDRTAQANHNASSRMRQFWRDQLALRPLPTSYPQPPNGNAGNYVGQFREPFVNAMMDPNAGFWTFPYQVPPPYQSQNPKLNPLSPNRSYPVFLDPVGWYNPTYSLQPQQFFIAGDPWGIPRRSLAVLDPSINPIGPAIAQSFCVQLDDQGFGKDGSPLDASGQFSADYYRNQGGGQFKAWMNSQQVQRDGRYTWGFLLASHPSQQDSADLTVVVYNGRSLDGPSDESVYPDAPGVTGAQFTQGSTEAIISYAGARPKVRKGTWILDATMTFNGQQLQEGPHGYFYRVVNVNDDQPGTLILELQTPAQVSTWAPVNGQTIIYGRAVVMEHVSEVFEGKTLNSVVVPSP
ncbi:MAG: prepilin-type N-terminal cleavage/methylation domain-containing protein [Gemmataceae bacterium]